MCVFERSMFKSEMSTRNRPGQRRWFLWMRSIARSLACASLAVLLPGLVRGQAASTQIAVSTPLSIQLLHHVPMKTGEALEGRLLYPTYVENRVALPAGTILRGSVVQLDSDHSRRIHARLRGDFTPFHICVVQFNQVVLPDGTLESIESDRATDGVAVLHLSPPPDQKKRSFLGDQVAQAKQELKETAALFTTPGRGDRLVQFVYTQLPYHPQRIDAGTTWTVELTRPLNLSVSDHPPMGSNESVVAAKQKPNAAAGSAEQDRGWQLHAYLLRTISSAQAKPGDTFQAMVADPVFNADHALVVPQGSLMIGEITQAKAARSFGRQGKLRFRFRELRLPGGFTQPMEGTLAGIDSNKKENLKIDSEGGVQQKQSQSRVIVPVVLNFLAGRAFDTDENQVFNRAVASNGFGIMGRIAGILANSRDVAAGIGFYAAALSVYDLWLAHGRDVAFTKNTRIEITTMPGRGLLNGSGIRGQAPAPR
jgi:hypothetical protein